jgi:hypothetical protein
MLRSLKDLERYTISASNGDVGKVVNFLLEDEHWTIRYLVAETDGLINGRQVLISPISFRKADWETRHFHVALTMEKVKKSPSVNTHIPISRQYERDYYRYYGYPYYWGYLGLWGMGGYPGLLADNKWDESPNEHSDKAGDVHLRSVEEVRGYHIQGNDEGIGHIIDFIVDDESWEVRYLVIDTSNWWFGKKVLVSPHWASQINWAEKKVYLDLSQKAIKSSPVWDPTEAINREYESRLYDYYGRPVYWNRVVRPMDVPPENHPSTQAE